MISIVTNIHTVFYVRLLIIGSGIDCGRQYGMLPFTPHYRISILILPSFLSLVCDMASQYEVICPKCVSFSSLSSCYMLILPQFSDLTMQKVTLPFRNMLES